MHFDDELAGINSTKNPELHKLQYVKFTHALGTQPAKKYVQFMVHSFNDLFAPIHVTDDGFKGK